MLFQEKKKETKKKFDFLSRLIFGFFSGFVSAIMGIAGAIINVPVLRHFGYPIKKAIGSAAAIGFIIALFGTIGFLFRGKNEVNNISIVKKILNIMGKSTDLIHFVKDRQGHDFRYSLDSDKIFKELQWKPEYSFEKGLENTISWYIKNKKFY